MTKNLFRADIEGMRALAVLLVFAAHFEVPHLLGGFVGVDVFFVLSGYVITSSLITEFKNTKTISLKNFYARRFRRLLPILLIVLVVSAAVCTVMISPLQHEANALSLQFASVWLSNHYFSFWDINYFSNLMKDNLFLHTWSLGVEEQFYLLWPSLLLFILGAIPWQSHRDKHKKIEVKLVLIALTSFAATIYATSQQSLIPFYLMPFRIWEFTLGALTFLLVEKASTGFLSQKINACLNFYTTPISVLGIVLIGIATIILNSTTNYPGYWTLLPCVGTVLLLYAGGVNQNSFTHRLLSSTIMQRIGNWSYGLYLWHWPILMLGLAIFPEDSLTLRLSLLLTTFLLSITSYYFIEKPIRQNNRILKAPILFIFVSLSCSALMLLLAEIWKAQAHEWTQTPTQTALRLAKFDVPEIYQRGCDDWFKSSNLIICEFGPKKFEHTAVLIGDSIGAQWAPAIISAYTTLNWRVIVLTKSSCPMVDQPVFNERLGKEFKVCAEWRKAALAFISSLKSDIVYLGNSNNYAFTDKQWVEGSKRVIAQVTDSAKKIIIIRGTPELGKDGPSCLSQKLWQPEILSLDTQCKSQARSLRTDNIFQQLQSSANQFQNAAVLDFNNVVCPANVCAAQKDDYIVFRDNQHITASFARAQASRFLTFHDAKI